MTKQYTDFAPTHTWSTCTDDHVYVECPECKSTIRLDSRKCKHCHTDVSNLFAHWQRAWIYLAKQERRQAQVKGLAVISFLFAAPWITMYLIDLIK